MAICLVKLWYVWFVRKLNSLETFSEMKSGSLGSTNSISLLTLKSESMVGLWSGCCCAHKRLTCMQPNTSDTTYESPKLELINSKALYAFRILHARITKSKLFVMLQFGINNIWHHKLKIVLSSFLTNKIKSGIYVIIRFISLAMYYVQQ